MTATLQDEIKSVADLLGRLDVEYGDREKDGFYYRVMVKAGFRLMCADGVGEALAILSELPIRYFKTILPEQLEKDAILFEMSKSAANKLIEVGVVVPEYKVDFSKTALHFMTGLA